MRIITLGTGAGRPTLHRNASATALEFNGELFLFDCGEGTQIQLMRSPLKWGGINAIFIGHLHGDHLYGLPGLLGTLSLSDRELPLKIFGPPGIKNYLRVLQECKSMWLRFPTQIQEITQAGIILDTKDFQVETARLDHVIECWGYVFREKTRRGHFDAEKADRLGIPEGPLRGRLAQGETVQLENGNIIKPEDFLGSPRPGRSVAYCLDTKPCRNVVQLAREVDLLIHEATFDHQLRKECHDWGHATAADAAEAAKQAGAKNLLITHISQRYPDAQILLQEAQAIFRETILAEDLKEYQVESN